MSLPDFFLNPSRTYLQKVFVNTAVAGTINLIPAVAGKKIRIYKLAINVAGTQDLTFRDTTPTVLWGILRNGFVFDFDGIPWFEGAIGKGIELILGSAVQTSGYVWYTQDENP